MCVDSYSSMPFWKWHVKAMVAGWWTHWAQCHFPMFQLCEWPCGDPRDGKVTLKCIVEKNKATFLDTSIQNMATKDKTWVQIMPCEVNKISEAVPSKLWNHRMCVLQSYSGGRVEKWPELHTQAVPILCPLTWEALWTWTLRGFCPPVYDMEGRCALWKQPP